MRQSIVGIIILAATCSTDVMAQAAQSPRPTWLKWPGLRIVNRTRRLDRHRGVRTGKSTWAHFRRDWNVAAVQWWK